MTTNSKVRQFTRDNRYVIASLVMIAFVLFLLMRCDRVRLGAKSDATSNSNIPLDAKGWRFQYVIGRLYGGEKFGNVTGEAIHDALLAERIIGRGDPDVAGRIRRLWPDFQFELWEKADVPLELGQGGKLTYRPMGAYRERDKLVIDEDYELDWSIFQGDGPLTGYFCILATVSGKKRYPATGKSWKFEPLRTIGLVPQNRTWPLEVGGLTERGRVVVIQVAYQS